MADANTTVTPNPVKVAYEAREMVGEVLANIDCLFVLKSTGDIESLMDSSLDVILNNALIRLGRAQELLEVVIEQARALTDLIESAEEGGAA